MYDFKMLSDYDFELLSKDLLEKALNCRLESFKKGKDQGIDLRYSSNKRNNIIIQCKHYVNSTFSNLKSKLKLKEYEKVKLLEPSRYILVTSLGLTPVQKDELIEILHPYCKTTGDIIGNNELNGFLRQYPEVERSHYKLWMTSTSVLEKIMHSSVYNRSEISIDIILTKLKLYVQNKAFFEALEILDKTHCCIISGIPGIGKTTLAEMLLTTYLKEGYDVFKISQNMKEAFEVYSSKKKQIFLYDDFLGQTGLELKLEKNEDQDILNFMRYVEKDGHSKFIMTTREYILNQAKATYESLNHSTINLKKYILDLSNYSKHDKAKILFNHVYYKDLPQSYIENLLSNDITKIINHDNYNPRIIEILTDNLLTKDPEDFYDSFIVNLDNPNKIWRFAFENHISPEAKNLLILLTTLPLKSEIKNVKTIFTYYHSEKCRFFNKGFSDRDFMNALKELEGSFIRIDEGFISFHNPSVKDFVEITIFENESEYELLCNTSICFEQCISLFNLARKTDFKLVNRYMNSYAEALLNNLLAYKIKFAYSIIGLSGNFSSDRPVIQRIITVMKINDILKSKKIFDYLVNDFFSNLSCNFDYYGIKIGEYIQLLKILQEEKFKKYFDEYVVKEIINYVICEILSNNIYEIDDFYIITIIEDLYPELITENIFEEIAKVFSEFSIDDYESVVDWGGVEEIDDYISTLKNLGDYFYVNVDKILEVLESQKDRVSSYDEESLYDDYKVDSQDEQFSDVMIFDMFGALSR